MLPISGIALFSEDVRREMDNLVTVVGVMPDNLEVPGFPGALAKLALYARIHIDIDFDPNPLRLHIAVNGTKSFEITSFEADLVNRTREDARDKQNPYAGLLAHSVFSPFPVPEAALLEVVMSYGNEEAVIGALRISGSTAE